jgi:hypothetical protein
MRGKKTIAGTTASLVALLCFHPAVAQAPLPQSPAAGVSTAAGQTLSPQQLDNLVAPIALYPDPLLGEVLAASTYPIEIAEAEQWVRDHPKWKPTKLLDEAKKENWDPSVQGLVAFPDVLVRLSGDIAYTTSLGNAFLAQQTDVMQGVQRMRAQAQARGMLHSTPQQTLTTENQNGQSAINIEPADPDVWYVPEYNPVYVWGPPAFGYYPPLIYPGVDIGFGWGPGIDLGLYFGGWGGWGWGGWGWMPNWYGGGIIMNHSFFHRYGFNHFHGAPMGRSIWVHDPDHRLGLPYANREVTNRFSGRAGGSALAGGGNRNVSTPRPGLAEQRFGSRDFEQRAWTGNRSVFGGYHNGGMSRLQSDHGFGSMGAGRTFGGGFRGGAAAGRRR